MVSAFSPCLMTLSWFLGGSLFVVLQGSAEVMEEDNPTSHTVQLKQVFCK